MKKLLFTLSTLLFLFPPGMSAQILTRASHSPLTSDSLLVYKVAYVAPSDTGQNCVWNFSGLSTDSAEMVDVNYYPASEEDTTLIGLHREHANYYYKNAGDTLWQAGYETSRAIMRYTTPIASLCFPFAFGDTLCGTLEGQGQYCHMTPLAVEGSIKTCVDGTGRLITPDDTIDGALRTHMLMTYSEKMHPQNIVREERLAWYSLFCRYPLVESVTVQTIKNSDTVTFASTYYYPQEQDEELRRQYEEEHMIANAVEDTLVSNIRFTPNPVYNNVQIKYELARPAKVYISLHYNGGMTTHQTPMHQEEEGEHTVEINMSNMPVGSYAVYIHADDVVASGSLIKL